MAWKQVTNDDDTPVVDREGRYLWTCHKNKHRAKSLGVPGKCSCLETVCKHLGPQLGAVPCGCGEVGKLLPVYRCNVLEQCTERSSNKPQRFQGKKIAVCLGCPKREEVPLTTDNLPAHPQTTLRVGSTESERSKA